MPAACWRVSSQNRLGVKQALATLLARLAPIVVVGPGRMAVTGLRGLADAGVPSGGQLLPLGLASLYWVTPDLK